MMKSLLLTGAAVAALATVAAPASAADLPRKSVAPAPFVQPVPVFNWTGFYVGLNGGYAFDGGKSQITGSPAFLGLAPAGNLKTIGDGFTIGATVGYNYQINNFVAGLEADLNYIDVGKSVSQTISGVTTVVSQDPTYLGTVRGRLGVTFDRLLVYGTGGLAFGNQDAATTVSTGAGQFWSGGKDDIKFGWTLGAGVEYAVTNNLSAKIEYLYYDLGKTNYSALQSAGASLPGVFADTSAENRGNIVRAGINYRF
jgi:outer membrane immunogenic protein